MKFIYLLLILFLSLPLQAQTKTVIVKDSKSDYIINLNDSPSPNDLRAAEILQKYISEMTGCKLEIVQSKLSRKEKSIVINPDKKALSKYKPGNISEFRKNIKDDGFLISVQNNQIIILSDSTKGSIYGVVYLLENYFGCRKYAPGADYIPKHQILELPEMIYVQNPANKFRVVYGEFSKDIDYRDWQRLNVVDEVFADGYYVHTFNRLVPWETYFSSHPEYFSMMNGKRIKDQLCLSNTDVYQIALAKLKEEMAKQPLKKLWSVSQNDNFSYCQCDNCSKIIEEEGSPAGPIIRFVNKIAAEFPDKTISTLAYQYSRKAPFKTKPAENVQIMLCTIECNRSKPIEQDSSSLSFKKDIIDWGEISKNIYLWDYTVNFSHHISPFPNLHTLQPNIQFFNRNGSPSHFQQSNTDVGHELSELKNYLLARLLWNTNIDVDSIMQDFLNGYYGAAGIYIQKYINRLTSEIKKTGEWLDIYGHPVSHSATFLSADNMKMYVQWFDEAEEAVKNQPEILKRVQVARLPIQYAILEIGKNDMFGTRGFYSEKDANYTLKPEMNQIIEKFYAVCRENTVKTINEAGLNPDEYYKSTKRFIDVQVEGNLAFRKTFTANPLPSTKYGNGDLKLLTNGVQGSSDYKVHWLGWEKTDAELILDLGSIQIPEKINISTLYDPKSWILHPKSISCMISEDGINYNKLETIEVKGEQQKEDVTRNFTFDNKSAKCRFVKFAIAGTKELFNWHPSAGGGSWFFVDEIVVR